MIKVTETKEICYMKNQTAYWYCCCVFRGKYDCSFFQNLNCFKFVLIIDYYYLKPKHRKSLKIKRAVLFDPTAMFADIPSHITEDCSCVLVCADAAAYSLCLQKCLFVWANANVFICAQMLRIFFVRKRRGLSVPCCNKWYAWQCVNAAICCKRKMPRLLM